MKLLKLSYTAPDWELKDLELNSVNLIVAKNGTGKSRTLLTLDLMIKIITQRTNFLDRGGYWSSEFQNNKGQKINYLFSTTLENVQAQSTVIEEKMIIDGAEVLVRDQNNAWVKNIMNDSKDIVTPPQNKLVLHTNRDLKKYPFLEEITNWADNSYGFRFANIISSSNLNGTFFELLNPVYDIPVLFWQLNDDSRKSVVAQFNNIGYNISEITPEKKGEDFTIFIKEHNLEKPLPHWQLAQGMYRALSIIIFLEYLTSLKKPAMVLIDDLCEGLDYARAIELGKLIFDKCSQSEIQLVATSNDSFLMDIVDIKYWNILRRKGKIVTALNNNNNPKIFSDFRFTGLSNFDFFASDFLKQELE